MGKAISDIICKQRLNFALYETYALSYLAKHADKIKWNEPHRAHAWERYGSLLFDRLSNTWIYALTAHSLTKSQQTGYTRYSDTERTDNAMAPE